MTKSIDFYFDFISPYSYLAYRKIKSLSNVDEINIIYRPILLGGLHKLGGITAPAFNEHKLRKLYGGMFKDNVGSVKAYLNANWVIEGILKNQYVHKKIEQDRILVACFNPSLYNEDYYREGLHKFEDIYPSN